MNEIYDRLKIHDPIISLIGSFENLSLDEVIHTNNDKLVNAYIVEGDQHFIQEYAFACLTVDFAHPNNTVILYLVSKEYNLSDTPNPYIPGRFILQYQKERNIITTFAIAEEPAKPLSSRGTAVERLYLQSRRGHDTGEFSTVFTSHAP